MDPLYYENNALFVLDQVKLPGEACYQKLTGHYEVAGAIKNMAVRGAPAIGIAGGYGIALGAQAITDSEMPAFLNSLEEVIQVITSTRPTAQNLFQVAGSMRSRAAGAPTPYEAKKVLLDEAARIHKIQKELDIILSGYGLEVVPDGATIFTHCNTGALATGGYGTAFGIIRAAHDRGKNIQVLATETRPLLQGARLTAFELKEAGIPFRLITDSMAGHFMQKGEVTLVITGADRVAANGDTANKIGTYSLAVLAKAHNIPFYIAAPSTTFDLATLTGQEIVIEEREAGEVTCFAGKAVAPEGIDVYNPAFDVTPAELITAFITEKGIILPEDLSSLR